MFHIPSCHCQSVLWKSVSSRPYPALPSVTPRTSEHRVELVSGYPVVEPSALREPLLVFGGGGGGGGGGEGEGEREERFHGC